MIRFQFFLLLTLAFASPVFAAPEIVDGDTLRIDGQRVRLWGFDAPEKRQSCRIDGVERPIGQEAANHLRSILAEGGLRCRSRDRD